MDNHANIVIDLPEHTTPEEAAQLLNAPGDSYFLVQVLPVGGGHRAYLRRYKQTAPTKAEIAAEHVDEATAMSILRANRDKPIRAIVSLLQAAGIKRKKEWVSEQLNATCAEDGQEEKALRVVEYYGSEPNNGPKDILDSLRIYKIKRSMAWAREKLAAVRAVSVTDKS